MTGLAIRVFDDGRIVLKVMDPEKTVMVRRLLFRWDAEPFVIGIEGHDPPPLRYVNSHP
jgi:hypothetical protein